MPTVVHGDFEWDEGKAASNVTKHGVSFEEAALAMKVPFSQDFDDGLQAANLVTLAASPSGRISTLYPPRTTTGSVSSARAMPRDRNDDL